MRPCIISSLNVNALPFCNSINCKISSAPWIWTSDDRLEEYLDGHYDFTFEVYLKSKHSNPCSHIFIPKYNPLPLSLNESITEIQPPPPLTE